MFTKWFGTRTLRQPAKAECFFRPELEALEDRLPPSSVHGMGGDNGNGNGNGNGGGHVNIHENIHITNSFNNATNSFNGSTFLAPPQQAAVGGLSLLSSLLAAELGNSNLNTLLNDEIALAVDSFLVMQPGIMAVPSLVSSLKTDIGTLTNAIGMNPLENSPIGHALGMVAFDVTMDALAAAQPTI
ncbi:MAG TPA: hypothetical protein VH643_18665 [Gemmataceae bacterium]|jgi:hypothetical protein